MANKKIESFDELPQMFSVAQLSQVLNISRTAAYDLTKEDGFPSAKIGGRVLVHREKFLKWLDKKLKEKK